MGIVTESSGYAAVDQLLDRLASRALTADEAEALIALLDGQEAAAMPAVFRRLHDAATEQELHAAVRILARWIGRPVAAALPPALRALLTEPAVADLNKLAAADLLRDLGQPVDVDVLAACLRDPDAVAERALAVAVRASRRPPALANALDSIAIMPAPHVRSLIDGLTQLGQAGAAPLLAALTHHPDEDVSVSAVAAIDVLGLAEAGELLAIAAAQHPSRAVRDQAWLTLERVSGPGFPDISPAAEGSSSGAGVVTRAGSGFAGQPGSSSAGDGEPPDAGGRPRPLGMVHMSAEDPVTGRFAVLAKAGESSSRGETLYDVLTVHYHDEDGVRQYAAAELATGRDIEDLLAELAAAGVPAAREDPETVRDALRRASGRSLAGGVTALGYLAWPTFL